MVVNFMFTAVKAIKYLFHSRKLLTVWSQILVKLHKQSVKRRPILVSLPRHRLIYSKNSFTASALTYVE
jgi:hypothetical protein